MLFVIFPPFLKILLTSFSVGTEKFICFSVFSPKQVNYHTNFFASSFMIKWESLLDPLWKIMVIS